MTKMFESRLGSARIAAIAGCSRNFFDSLIHCYNNKGIDSVLEIATIPGRPGRLKGHMDEISGRLESEVPRGFRRGRAYNQIHKLHLVQPDMDTGDNAPLWPSEE